MKKVFLIFAVLFLAGPLCAQRIIRYITFYPVPYGSHSSLNVEDMLMMNMSNEAFSKVTGDFSVEGKSEFEGFVNISAASNEEVKTGGYIVSGSGALDSYGVADLQGDIYISEIYNNYIPLVNVSGVSYFNGSKLFFNGHSLSDLSKCSSPSWKALRLKGSEECKYYLTCGGGGATGCES